MGDTSWQKEFLEMKAQIPSDVRLLKERAKVFKDAQAIKNSSCVIRKIEEKARGSATALKKEINWNKEFYQRAENSTINFKRIFQIILLRTSCRAYILDIFIPNGKRLGVQIKMIQLKTKDNWNTHLKTLKRKSNYDNKYFPIEESESPHY